MIVVCINAMRPGSLMDTRDEDPRSIKSQGVWVHLALCFVTSPSVGMRFLMVWLFKRRSTKVGDANLSSMNGVGRATRRELGEGWIIAGMRAWMGSGTDKEQGLVGQGHLLWVCWFFCTFWR